MEPRRQRDLLWGGVALALVAMAPLGRSLAGALPACPLKSWTGLPCPGCGTTRAALALGHLDPLAAFAVSPLAAAAWMGLIGGGLLAGAFALAGRELPGGARLEAAWSGQWSLGARLAVVAAVALNWLYLLYTGA